MTSRYRATLAYDGSAYQGFQRQADGIPTVQAAVEQAISRVLRQPVTVIGSGRTDTGVHARGQVIAFDAGWRHSDAVLLRAVNALLPSDIALQDLCRQPGFHPRFDARSRYYTYTIVNASQPQPLLSRYSWHVWGRLALESMQQSAALLVGVHDFATFGKPPQGSSTVRHVLRCQWTAHDEAYASRLVLHIEGNAFLQHMVRRIVGMLVEVGLGRCSPEDFERVFRAADLSLAGPVAPPQGLVLEAVRYAAPVVP
jgi:tRNA pseudouridine38-40 synthase